MVAHFGGIWADDTENVLDSFSSLPFTTLFVDGNHENYDRLGAYPVSEWNGGKVQIIHSDIIHLMRGQVFRIDGKTFFTFGGAESHDKENRKYGESIWYEEIDAIRVQQMIRDAFKHGYEEGITSISDKVKEVQLNKEESITVLEMAQDAIDRGMIASHYETDGIEKVLNTVTNEFGDITKEVEIIIRVKE